jgi:iron complex outermembrane recepter protein
MRGQLWLWVGLCSVGMILPARAETEVKSVLSGQQGDLAGSVDSDRPATTVKEWIAQMEAAAVRVTEVRLNATDQGLQVILETEAGQTLQATQQIEGNSVLLTIPNAVLALKDQPTFIANQPAPGIEQIAASQADTTSIQLRIIGVNAVPAAQIVAGQGLVVAVTPGTAETTAAAEGEEEELVVTGETEEGYRVPNTSVGTRTDTPLRNVPRSIQVIPLQIIEDQQATNINAALENVPGVVPATSTKTPFVEPVIRGFSGDVNNAFRRNGFRDPFVSSSAGETANIERIEVLRGPASVLYGQGSVGGITNIVTKQPLSEPFYKIGVSVGSFDTYRGTADLSGPLNNSGTLRYRLNLAAGTEGSLTDFYDRDRYVVAAVLDWRLSENTKLTFDAEYSRFRQNTNAFGLPAVGTVLDNPNGEIPRNRYIGDPEADERLTELFRLNLSLDHKFSQNWQIHSTFGAGFRLSEEFAVFEDSLQADNRTLDRGFFDSSDGFDIFAYTLDTYLTGKFKTGSIQHQLVTGIELLQEETITRNGIFGSTTPLDLFNPEYGNLAFNPIETFDTAERKRGLGLYIQDQIFLLDNLILSLGGRFDIINVRNKDFVAATTEFQQNEAFSPQIGIVYRPIKPISLYASYSRSFQQEVGRSFDNSIFAPQRGTQYEIGVKADINDRLSTTLAFYDLTRSNVLTTDPNNPGFDIQTGEQNSRGIELNVAGEILPGWNITAGYAYNNARITKDNTFTEGNRLNNAPENAFSLWTTYRISKGNLSGLGFGLGLFYVGERQGDLANTFTLPGYLRTDAAIFYEREQFKVALNVRNLFDINYFESAESDLRVFPGEPLTVSFSFSWKF